MSYVPPAVEHVAKKIARTPGVEASYIGKDGAVDAVLETAFDRTTRQHVLDIGRRALVPVRVFYRMPDDEVIGESVLRKYESLDDYYTHIHVAGFADDVPKAPADDVGGDAYGTKDVRLSVDARDGSGQLKLSRIRATTRGRPVIGWKHGDSSLRVGDKIKFRRPCCLQWTQGRTVNVAAGATASVSQMSSRRPIAYLSLGGNEKVELPIHAAGHVYDVMVDPRLESVQEGVNKKLGYMTPELKRLVMAVGFGRAPGIDDTPTNTAHFNGPSQPDLIKYSSPEEDMLVPSKGSDSKPSGDRDDDRSAHVVQKEPRMTIRRKGKVQQKKALFSKKR